jgi:catechol 2,3-dioxygenase-like lactoylglutathione lyase family enzyme
VTGTSTSSLSAAATLFVVRDVLRSVEYYRDVLGFHTEFTYGEPVCYAGVERDHVAIHLQAASDTKRQPGHGGVNVFVTDVDALYEELKSRGARTLNEPKDLPVRHARFRHRGSGRQPSLLRDGVEAAALNSRSGRHICQSAE